MNSAQFNRLKPFLKGISYKSKLFIYLLAEGFTPVKIQRMTKKDITGLADETAVPTEIALCIETLLANSEGEGDQPIFVYPNARKYSVANIEDVLIRACEAVDYPYAGIRQFARHIATGKR